MVEDLDSTRGTWIDGKKISGPAPVRGAFHVYLGDDTAGAEVRVVTAGVHETPTDHRPLIIAGVALMLGLIALAVVLFRGGDDDLTPEALPLDSPIEVAPPAEEDEPDPETAIPAEEIARSIVQPVGTLPDGQVCSTGSGTHVGDGLILTNFHVIGVLTYSDPDCRFRGDIAIADAPDQPTVIRASATIVAVDPAADLAVLRLIDDLDLPALELSTDQPALGSRIRIFGFPGIGGGTLTVTSGQVSGFLDDVHVGPGAWIKTDATVAGGNSGGAAVDDEGRLIGVPTVVGASTQTTTVECRALADTNGDGVTDDNDTCVSVGGFLNGIRPVKLATSLLEEAATAPPFDLSDPALDLNAVDANADFDAISIDGLRIDGFDFDGNPVSDPAEIDILCATFAFSGIDTGLAFVSAWALNENYLADGTLQSFWGADTAGETTSCYRPLGGVAPGTYLFVVVFGLDLDVGWEVEAQVG